MEFSALPEELIFKVFSYLLHRSLLAASQVSKKWKKVAFDPLLWTEITIDASIESPTMHVGAILRRATMLRRLDISRSSLNLGEVASATPSFRHLNELAIHSSMLSHPAVPQILQSCESLTSLVLRGRCALSEENIQVLENLPGLKSLDVSEEVRMCDEIIRRICLSCPRLEELKVNTKSVRVSGAWSSFLAPQAPLRDHFPYKCTAIVLPLLPESRVT
ncbi:hypothetical protein HPB48_026502 [Haemaphysalis longicornis]|uniref:F-box domain-containing protein n=1 Tax=Haemaphysalis longicornis TaxID=44386 RepID=A0A9J6H9N8_HAELO|nr:hypothetical protein HPB48_026502 [Haemaphysalis longicornis]